MPAAQPTPAAPEPASNSDLIRVHEPASGALIHSPLHIAGEARGTWFFEASFPVNLLDANGATVARGHAEARSDWMTENFVPFQAELPFEPPSSATGTVVLEKSNPSDLPENADQIRVAVRFR